jgi:hypothetical protein
VRHRRDTPHQVNSYDCGVYVLTLSEHAARCYADAGAPPAAFGGVTPAAITERRHALAALAARMAAADQKA